MHLQGVMADTIKDISEYISKIKEIVDKKTDDNNFLVYRGEPRNFPTHGQPGIFRNNYLKDDPYFEKNLLLEMKANKLTSGNTYLEMAIDAQHGGFPSRLLDVTYNSLIALYFACVSKPEFEKEEAKHNSHVLVYTINRAYCPTASNVIDNYKKIIDDPNNPLNKRIFECNHKFIDHIKVNSRIIAQQGALILFQGLEWRPIPEQNVTIIEISKNSKKSIADDLERFFGITTSSIFPEIDYSKDKIEKMAKRIVSDDFSIENELIMCFENEANNIEYQLKSIAKVKSITKKVTLVRNLEKQILAWKIDLLNFISDYEENYPEKNRAMKANFDIPTRYNIVIDKYKDMFDYYIHDVIKPCSEDLKMEVSNG